MVGVSEPLSTRRGLRLWWAAACAVAAGPLVFGLGHGFYQDDFRWLEQAFRSDGELARIVSVWRAGEFRPVAQLFFWLQTRVFGLRPLLFNLLGLVLHLVVAWMILRLSRRLGASQSESAAASLLFVAGWGHYGKPVAWACSHSILLGTALFLGAVRLLLADRTGAGPRATLHGAAAIILVGVASITHELFSLAPAILAASLILRRDPRRAWCGGIAAAMTGAYLLLTWGVHRAHAVHSGGLDNLARNFFHYPSAFLAPIQRLELFQRGAAGLGMGAIAEVAIRSLPFIIGGIWWCVIVWLFVRRKSLRGTIAVGLVLMAPPLLLPQPKGWIDVRHLYPAAAFLSPAAGSLVIRTAAGRGALLRVGLIFWCALILAGTAITQDRASRWSRSPGALRRLEEVRSIRDQRPNIPAPGTENADP